MSALANGELILSEFRAWVDRQRWNKTQLDTLHTAADAIQDIIHHRIDSTQLAVAEAIAMKERGEL